VSSDDEAVDVRPARPGDEALAPQAAALIAVAALEHDLARRPEAWLAAKLGSGRAAVALLGSELVGFGCWSEWEDGRWVSHSALVVRPDLRGLGLGRRLKELLLAGSRAAFPRARTLSLTTSPAVRALNLSLGFRDAPLDELTRDPAFWAGCDGCRNAAAARAAGRRCCCDGMVLAPEA
jgi:GNAT superfamily N-acetyltransferase